MPRADGCIKKMISDRIKNSLLPRLVRPYYQGWTRGIHPALLTELRNFPMVDTVAAVSPKLEFQSQGGAVLEP